MDSTAPIKLIYAVLPEMRTERGHEAEAYHAALWMTKNFDLEKGNINDRGLGWNIKSEHLVTTLNQGL
jgi:hypothetical protein